MTDLLKLSIVVPTRNRRDVLVSQTLPAIFEQNIPATEYEVIVVVDGSTDGTAETLRELPPPCSLRIIEQPQTWPQRCPEQWHSSGRKAICFCFLTMKSYPARTCSSSTLRRTRDRSRWLRTGPFQLRKGPFLHSQICHRGLVPEVLCPSRRTGRIEVARKTIT